MGDAHRAFGLVDMLAAGALRPEHIDAQVLVIDLNVDILGFRQHRHGGGGSVDAALVFSGGHPLHPVDATLEFQFCISAAAVDLQGGVLDAAQIAFGTVHHFGTPALQPAITLIHFQQVGGEQSGFIAAGAGADFHNGRGVIRRIPGQKSDAQVVVQLFQTLFQFRTFLFR